MTHKLPAVPYTKVAYTEITDADYPPVQETNMKTVTHKLWPVSYLNDDGKQVDSLYTFDPSNVDSSYSVGEPVHLATIHVEGMAAESRLAKIAELEEKLDRLKEDDHG